MIEDNALENRLNEYRDFHDDLPQPNHKKINNPFVDFLTNVITLASVAVKILAFGYTFKILFKTDWSSLETICIGIATTLILNYIYELIHGID